MDLAGYYEPGNHTIKDRSMSLLQKPDIMYIGLKLLYDLAYLVDVVSEAGINNSYLSHRHNLDNQVMTLSFIIFNNE
jgi:hypothetical protein